MTIDEFKYRFELGLDTARGGLRALLSPPLPPPLLRLWCCVPLLKYPIAHFMHRLMYVLHNRCFMYSIAV